MGLRERFQRLKKDSRLILAGLVLLLLAFSAAFYAIQRGSAVPASLVANRVILFALWYVNVVLILVVSFVLLRNLFRLLLERRSGTLGSTFKFKLVATYVGLSLIPVLLLFAIATELLQGSIDRWFNTPLRPVLEQANAVAQALYDQAERAALRDASRAAAGLKDLDLDSAGDRARLAPRLRRMLGELDLDFLGVYEGTEFVQAVVDSQAGIPDLPEPGRDFLEEAARRGRAVRMQEPPGGQGRLALAALAAMPAVPASPAERDQPAAPGAAREPRARGPATQSAATQTPPIIVVAGHLIDPALAERSETLIQDYQTFRQLEVQKDDLRASHLLIFLMVTLLILLASSWVGLRLARRVTLPIQALAEGTRRISDGDLAHRVVVEADDELGVLVDSFNRMTRELAAKEEQIEQGHEELVSTNRRLAEERALLAAVLENVAAGVVSIDRQGRIFTSNEAALRMLRQREKEVVGRRPGEAWSDPERGKLATLLAELPGRVHARRELQMVLGGEWKTFEVTVTAMGPGGIALGRVVVIEDLTELIQAQQLAAWSEAARRIAHEIKNPLTPIRLAAERLLMKSRQQDPGLPAAIEQGVEIIVREVGTLQGMVDEFSRFARMPRPRPGPVDLPRLLADTLHLYRDLKPGVEVGGGVAGELPGVRLDGEQIRRALINLIDNAVEATEPPGRVTVSAHAEDGHLEIQVADTGRGIPAEARDKLFRPYFSTKGRGTGLGLAIVHRIVADHHGTVRVEDNHPRGTVFTLELPIQ